ncbi:MAG: heavy-metal-associated domain-containing protein [Clostridiales bacterium]|nr:heavy-metal-associated domain-containing protein [Clostridiales bacterium]
MKNIVSKVEGMACRGCENRIKNALETIEGVSNVNANYIEGIVSVSLDDNISENTVFEKIEVLGFKVVKED